MKKRLVPMGDHPVKAVWRDCFFGRRDEAEDLEESMLHVQAAELQGSILQNDSAAIDEQVLSSVKGWKWWFLVSLSITFLLIGQAVAVMLGKLYYDEGGKSNWMATIVQTAGFPVLFLPLFFFPSNKNHDHDEPNGVSNVRNPTVLTIVLVYGSLGVLLAGDNLLYSLGLLYLPMSTYSLLCATQLAFNAVFSFFINAQKLTLLIINSIVLLSVSASLIAIHSDSTESKKFSTGKHLIGVVSTVLASAGYALFLSLMQLSFERVLRKETFTVVLDMQIYTSLVATIACLLGLLASGEMWTLKDEMESFKKGEVIYVLSLVGSALAWQVSSVGVVGLIYLVSSLFSNVVSMLTLPLVPVAGSLIYGEDMDWLKILAMFLAIFGCSSYLYQQYLDDRKPKVKI